MIEGGARLVRRLVAQRPGIRINQVGFAPGGPKRATIVTHSRHPLPFAVRLGDATVFSGLTEPWLVTPDPSSGMRVHVADFSPLSAEGDGFLLSAAGEASHPFAIAPAPLAPVLPDALRFFYLQRSGIEILDDVAPGYGRPPGHLGRAPNRGDTRVRAWSGADAERLYPGWREDGEFDVSGGWYDAGDHGKYVVNGGLSAAQLLGAFERDRLRRRDGAARVLPDALAAALLDEARWEVDWLLRMQVPPGRPLAGMAFHRVHDVEWAPLPMWPHEDPLERVLHRPSTAATLNLAAAAAHAARLVRDVDAAAATRYLDAARTGYDAALAHPDLLAPDDEGAFGGGPYGDDDVTDDFYWAAAELYLTTGEDRFLDDLGRSRCHLEHAFSLDGFDWNAVAAPARLDLAAVPSALPEAERVRQSVVDAADDLVALQRTQPWEQPYAPPDGWDWGSNGRILNNLIVIASAYDLSGERRFLDAASAGIDYLFGRNAYGLSYVTGFGTEFTRHQRTRHFAHDLDPAFPPPPPGALAGGPNSKRYPGFPSDPRLAGLPPQLCYLDEPTSEVTNDVCIRWNAALVWMAAFLGWN